MTSIGDTAAIEQHYAGKDIASRILAAIRVNLGPDTVITPDVLAPVDHVHSGGAEATRVLAGALQPAPGLSLLDIGSGIGGPARWIAKHYGCHVTGIDLTSDFCVAARSLNEATGLTEKVTIVEGNALDLPFADATFDLAYSQNVIMNIADKARFYREAFRVLRPGGRCAFANLTRGVGEPIYPVPWAQVAQASFLATVDETREQILASGFEIVSQRVSDPRDAALAREARLKLEGGQRPALGPHVFFGDRMFTYQMNSQRNVEEGRVGRIEVLVRKP
jgi:SAM-dependent methyltransferase